MPFIPVPNTAQVELVYNWQGEICQNVIHYEKSASWTAAQLLELCALVKTAYVAGLHFRMSNQLSLIEIKATDLSTQTGPSVTYTTGLPDVGAKVSASLPNNVAIVITKRTALRGRSFRGRIYHPGLTEGDVTGNIVASGELASIIGNWTSLLTGNLSGPIPYDMVVVSRQNNGAILTTGVTTPITNLSSDGSVDSQRRRLP